METTVEFPVTQNFFLVNHHALEYSSHNIDSIKLPQSKNPQTECCFVWSLPCLPVFSSISHYPEPCMFV